MKSIRNTKVMDYNVIIIIAVYFGIRQLYLFFSLYENAQSYSKMRVYQITWFTEF